MNYSELSDLTITASLPKSPHVTINENSLRAKHKEQRTEEKIIIMRHDVKCRIFLSSRPSPIFMTAFVTGGWGARVLQTNAQGELCVQYKDAHQHELNKTTTKTTAQSICEGDPVDDMPADIQNCPLKPPIYSIDIYPSTAEGYTEAFETNVMQGAVVLPVWK